MTDQNLPRVGRLVDVQGSLFTAELDFTETEAPPTVTVGSEDIAVGQIGSYLLVTQGPLRILCMVSRMAQREFLLPVDTTPQVPEQQYASTANLTVTLLPLGTLSTPGAFQRGVPTFPTTGAEVHALPSSQLTAIFARFSGKGYQVGSYSSIPGMPVYFDPTPLFGRHMAILGQTGAGKSWTVASLLQQAAARMPKAHVILLDLHGEYCWHDNAGQLHLAFAPTVARRVDATELEIPYWLLTFAELCDLLIDRNEFTAHNQVAFFREVVHTLRQREKDSLSLDRVTVDTPVYFSLLELVDTIAQKNEEMVVGSGNRPKQGPLFGAFDRFLIRLRSRLNDTRYDFLFAPKLRTASTALEPLLRDFVGLGSPKVPITVVDLSSVPFDVRPTVTAQIGRLAFEFNYWNPQYREFPLLLVCEEAHAYIPREDTSQYAGARSSMERIAKEGRKYGVGLSVVSQRPHELSETVLAQCGTFICLRMTNPSDQTYVRSLLPEAEQDVTDTISSLGRGEAMVLGEAVPLPTRVQFSAPDPSPHSDDIDFYEKWRNGPEDIDVTAVVDRWRRQSR